MRGLAAALLFALLAGAGWLLLQRRRPVPMPAGLSFLLESRYVERFAGPELLLERSGVSAGMRVLDAGCGAGRLAVSAARRVGPAGEVVALDVREGMLSRLRGRVSREGLRNVRAVRAALGEGELEEGGFDRVLLAMVLGEVRDREAALRELYRALRPGGVLSVTELFPDPDYRRPQTVLRLAEGAGFRPEARYGRFPAFTLNLRRPA
ncbi:class I SAM-dependent methyltransferase [Rubrobacter xylanophilus]|nr:methyltransferase domain-containing protein [Rubrobacter xylanophilus]